MKTLVYVVSVLFFSLPAFGTEGVESALEESERGNFNSAVNILKALDQSAPDVMYAWGIVYRNGGSESPPDTTNAFNWFQKSADAGNKEAQYTIARMYQYGDGAPYSPGKSVHYYKLASDQDFVFATFNLANRYYQGDIVKQDFQEAMKLFLKVANQKIPQGERMVGLMYLKGEGVNIDLAEARRWFEKAALNGLASAQNNMAMLWYGQQGHPKDLVKAYAWFVLAFRNGHPEINTNYREIIRPKLTEKQLYKAEKLISDLTSQSKSTR